MKTRFCARKDFLSRDDFKHFICLIRNALFAVPVILVFTGAVVFSIVFRDASVCMRNSVTRVVLADSYASAITIIPDFFFAFAGIFIPLFAYALPCRIRHIARDSFARIDTFWTVPEPSFFTVTFVFCCTFRPTFAYSMRNISARVGVAGAVDAFSLKPEISFKASCAAAIDTNSIFIFLFFYRSIAEIYYQIVKRRMVIRYPGSRPQLLFVAEFAVSAAIALLAWFTVFKVPEEGEAVPDQTAFAARLCVRTVLNQSPQLVNQRPLPVGHSAFGHI